MICQECGEVVDSPNNKHTIWDCAEHHLERSWNILGESNFIAKIEEKFKVQIVLQGYTTNNVEKIEVNKNGR